MVTINTTEKDIVFEINGWHKLWALKSSITIAKQNIVKAYQSDQFFTFWKGLRLPGTEIPGLITAGSYYKNEWNFWDVCNKKNTIIVELKDAEYKNLIIEVANPDTAINLLNTIQK